MWNKITKSAIIGLGTGACIGVASFLWSQKKSSVEEEDSDFQKTFNAMHLKNDSVIFDLLQRLRRYEKFDPRLFACIVRDCDILIHIHTLVHGNDPTVKKDKKGSFLMKAIRHEQNVKWRLQALSKKVKMAENKDFKELESELNNSCYNLKYNIQLESLS